MYTKRLPLTADAAETFAISSSLCETFLLSSLEHSSCLNVQSLACHVATVSPSTCSSQHLVLVCRHCCSGCAHLSPDSVRVHLRDCPLWNSHCHNHTCRQHAGRKSAQCCQACRQAHCQSCNVVLSQLCKASCDELAQRVLLLLLQWCLHA